MLGESTSFDWK